MADQDFLLSLGLDLSSLSGQLETVKQMLDSSFQTKTADNFSRQLRGVEQELQRLMDAYIRATGAQQGLMKGMASAEGNENIADILSRAEAQQRNWTSSLVSLEQQKQRAIEQTTRALQQQTDAMVDLDRQRQTAMGGPGNSGYYRQEFKNFMDDPSRPSQGSAKNSASVFMQGGSITSRETGKVVGNLEAQGKILEENTRKAGAWDRVWQNFGYRFATHLVQWGAWNMAMAASVDLIDKVAENFEHAISNAAQFQKLGVQFVATQRVTRDEGMQTDNTNSGQLFAESARLAQVYGQKVNEVAGDVSLWYKATGDLNASLFMTNQALKFQLVTGDDLEDVYRTLTGLSIQAKGLKLDVTDKTTFNLTQTPRLLNSIFAAATAAGAGMAHFSDGANNATKTLMEGLQQDVSALGNLGLNINQIIALDQGLITAMGNTGAAAESVGERMARFVAGIASLSDPSKATTLFKGLDAGIKTVGQGPFEKFQQMVNSTKPGEFFNQFVSFYNTLDDRSKNVLATNLASQRNYELQANTIKVMLGQYEDILRAEKDSNLLNDTALRMQGTLNQTVNRLGSEWTTVIQIIASGLIPLLTKAAQIAANVVPLIGNIAKVEEQGVGSAAGSMPGYTGYLNAFESAHDPDARYHAAISSIQAAAARRHISLPANWQQTPNWDAETEGFANWDENSRFNARVGYAYQNLARAGVLSKLGLGNRVSTTGGTMLGNTQYFTDPQHVNDYMGTNWLTKQSADLLKRYGGPGTAPDQPVVTDPSGKGGRGGGIEKAAEQERTAIQDLDQQFKDLISTQTMKITLDDEVIRRAQRQVDIFGNVGAATAYVRAQQDKQNQLARENVLIAGKHATAESVIGGSVGEKGSQILKLQQAAAGQLAMARAAGLNTQQGSEFMSNYRQIEEHLDTIKQKWMQNKAAIDESIDSTIQFNIKTAQAALDRQLGPAQYNLTTAQYAYEHGRSIGDKERNFRPYYNAIGGMVSDYQTDLNQTLRMPYQNSNEIFQREIQDRTRIFELQHQQIEAQKQYNDEIQATLDDLSKQAASAQASLSDAQIGANRNLKPWDATFLKDQAALTKELVDNAAEFQTTMSKVQGDPVMEEMAIQTAETQMQTVKLNEATAEYQRRLEEIKSSAAYQGMDAFIQSLTGSIVNASVGNIFGTTQQANYFTQQQQTIDFLKQQYQLTNQIFQLQQYHTPEQKAAHDLEMLQLNQQNEAMERQLKLEQEQASKPNMLKTAAQNMAKAFETNLLDQFGGSTLKNLFNLDPNDKVKQSMDIYKKSTEDLSQAMTNFQKEVDKWISASNTPGGTNAPAVATGGTNNTSVPGVNINQTVGVITNVSGTTAVVSTSTSGIANQGTNTPANAAGAAQNTAGYGAFAAATGAAKLLGTKGGIPVFGGGSAFTVNGQNANANNSQNLPAGNDPYSITTTPVSSMPVQVSPVPNVPGVNGNAPATIGDPRWTQGGDGAINKLFGIPKGGIGAGPGSVGKYMTIAGDLYGEYTAITGGGGLSNAITGAEYGAQIGSLFGPAGTAIGAGAGFLLGLFGIGNHDNPQQMPDKYDTLRYTTEIGELVGYAGTAYGPPFNAASDPVISQLGGKPMLVYIEQWIKANENSGSNVKRKLAQQLKTKYGDSGRGTVTHGHDIGQISVDGGSLRGEYTDVYNAAMGDLQQILTIENDMSTPDQLVALNQYGGSSGFMPFSWNTPGYDFPATPPGTGTITGGSGAPIIHAPTGPGKGLGGSGGGVGPAPVKGGGGVGTNAYAYSPVIGRSGGMAVVVQQPPTYVVMDSRVMARSVQAQNLRTRAQGYRRVT